MPTQAYIKIEGAQQGLITSGANSEDSMGTGENVPEYEDYSTVIAFKHQITLPSDPRTGQPSGARIHRPLMIHKVFDKASPLLYKALCTGERLEVEIIWERTKDGKDTKYFTHKLEDALIVDMEAEMPLMTELLGKDSNNIDILKNSARKQEEKWYFSYRKIEWEHTEASTSSSDDWQDR